jgi:hypothetical protein
LIPVLHLLGNDRIDIQPASEILSAFGNSLFLTQSEFQNYVGTRSDKNMLVLTLEDAKTYPIPLKLKKSVTMAGCYMTRGKELYRYSFLDLFQLLQNELEANQTWVVVGYRFNDEIIRNMFLDANRTNPFGKPTGILRT